MVTLSKSYNGNIYCRSCSEIIGSTKDELFSHLEIVHEWERINNDTKRNYRRIHYSKEKEIVRY